MLWQEPFEEGMLQPMTLEADRGPSTRGAMLDPSLQQDPKLRLEIGICGNTKADGTEVLEVFFGMIQLLSCVFEMMICSEVSLQACCKWSFILSCAITCLGVLHMFSCHAASHSHATAVQGRVMCTYVHQQVAVVQQQSEARFTCTLYKAAVQG